MLLQPTDSWTWSDFGRRSVLIPGFRDANSITENLSLANQIATDNYYAGNHEITLRGHWSGTNDIVLFVLVEQSLVTEKMERYGLDWYLSLDRGDCVRILRGGGETACEVSESGLTIPSVGNFVFDRAYSRASNTESFGHSRDPEFFKDKDHLCENVECFPNIVALAQVGLPDLTPPIKSAAENPDTAQRTPTIRAYIVLLSCDLAGKPVVLSTVTVERNGQVKFVAGIDRDSQYVIVFDSHLDLHNELSELHQLRPVGGGWLEIDTENRQLTLGGSSLAFNREPDRLLTLRMIERALPDFDCTMA